MTLFLISFIAGLLTVLAPCILPLLPVVIGSSVTARSKATPYVVIGSLALSIFLFTFLLKASTALIDIPQSFWAYLSGGILIVFGLFLVFPSVWSHIPFVNRTNNSANSLLGAGHEKKSIWGDVLVGASLGPVFSSCSPTYFVILATVLPVSFLLGTIYLLAYIAGLVSILALIAALGQKLTTRLQFVANNDGWFKRSIGLLFIVVGIFIFTGNDKKVETWVLDNGYIDGVLEIEQNLLDSNNMEIQNEVAPKTIEKPNTDPVIEVPTALERNFPNTDYSKADSALESAISGGPPKDGIPAINEPKFLSLSDYDRPDDIQSIVLVGNSEVKVYPYNILTWHEIVNDEIDGTPVAITFCPLCGSAIVFNRTLPDGQASTFGVSGSLLESNMIMYDRLTENLWQQSTGKTLAGSFYPSQLALEPFQLLSLGEAREVYPEALVLSEATGHSRDYARNPYAGYDENDQFAFDPSNLDATFSPKLIMAVFRNDSGTTFTAPWLLLREKGSLSVTHEEVTYTLTATENGELTIADSNGNNYPFYFEMWFSVSVQNGEELVVIDGR